MNDSQNEINKKSEQMVLDDVFRRIRTSKEKCIKIVEDNEYKIEEAKEAATNIDLTRYKNEIVEANDNIEFYNPFLDYRKKPYETHIDMFYDNEYDVKSYLFGDEEIKAYDKESYNKEGYNKQAIVLKNSIPLYIKLREACLKNKKTFELNDEKIVIELFREVVISKNKIISIKDRISSDGIINNNIDSELIELKRNDSIDSSIYNTIGLEQIEIVTDEKNKNMLIQGCAGSGKSVILLHRLSYILMQLDDKDKRDELLHNIIIISPSKNLINMYSDLTKLLGLKNIINYVPEELYIMLLSEYCKELKFDTQIINENNKVDFKILSHIYQDGEKEFSDFINKEINIKEIAKRYGMTEKTIRPVNVLLSAKIKTELLIDGNMQNKFDDFIAEVSDDIKKMQKDLVNENRNLFKIKKYLTNFVEKNKDKIITNQSNDNVSNYKLTEAINKIKDFELNIINDYFSESGLKKKYKLELNIEHNIEVKKDNNVLKIKEILDNFDRDNVISNRQILLEIINKKEIKECVKGLDYSFEHDFKKRVNEIAIDVFGISLTKNENKDYYIDLLYDYVITKFTHIANFILEKYMQNLYESNNISYDRHIFRHKLFLLLSAANKYYEKLDLRRYLYFDESQDYSTSEFELFHSILGKKCIFNLYGDINQTIQDYRSISNWDTLSFIDNQNIHLLNYNYRNTNQIIDFINKITNKSIIGIGLEGEKVVEYIELKDALYNFYEVFQQYDTVKDKSKVSFAIIIPNDIDIDSIMNIVKTNCELDDLEEFIFDSVDFSKISVINVDSSKGLEFTCVLVLDSGLTVNQLYVATTRAIKILHYYKGDILNNNILDDEDN